MAGGLRRFGGGAWIGTVAAIVLALPACALGAAAPGDIDTTFGTGGAALASFGATNLDKAADVAQQADGKLVVVGSSIKDFTGSLVAVRLNADGSPDTGFGVNGVASASAGLMAAGATSVIIDGAGKIIVGGYAGDDFAVARFNSNGTLDTAFGTGGIVTTPVGEDWVESFYSHTGMTDMVRQNDGRLVAIGVDSGRPVIVRYNVDGSLDTAFGSSGIVRVTAAGDDSGGLALAMQTDQKILFTGGQGLGAAMKVIVGRLTTAGALDTTFDGDGLTSYTVTFSAFTGAAGRGLLVNSTAGTVTVGASIRGGAAGDLRRFLLSNGAVDTTFGSGTAHNVITTPVQTLRAAADGSFFVIGEAWWHEHHEANGNYLFDSFAATNPALPDGSSDSLGGILADSGTKLVVVGIANGTDGSTRMVAVRSNATDMERDTSFGSNGVSTLGIATGPLTRARAVVRMADDSLMVAGQALFGEEGKFVLAHFTRDGVLDTGFGTGGAVVAAPGDPGGRFAFSLAQMPDGDVVFGGGVADPAAKTALLRYSPSGVPRAGFGNGGTALIGGIGQFPMLVPLANGNLLVGSFAGTKVSRVKPDGTLDASFASSGSATTCSVRGLAVDPATQNFFVPCVVGGAAPRPVEVRRYSGANGALDTTFGANGIASVTVGLNTVILSAIVRQPDGKVLVGGSYDDASGQPRKPFIVRFGAGGAVDSGFGSGGVVRLPSLTNRSVAGIVVQTDGKLLAELAGSVGQPIAVERFNADGTPDTGFGVGGMAATASGLAGQAVSTPVNSLVQQSGGRIVAAATAGDQALAMLLTAVHGDPVPEAPAPPAGGGGGGGDGGSPGGGSTGSTPGGTSGSGDGGTTGSATAPVIRFGALVARVDRSGRFRFGFSTAPGARGTVAFRTVSAIAAAVKRRVSLGTKPFVANAAGKANVRVTLTRPLLRALRKAKRLALIATVRIGTTRKSVRLTLRAR